MLYGDDHHADRRTASTIDLAARVGLAEKIAKNQRSQKAVRLWHRNMSEVAGDGSGTYSASFTRSVFARFDALDERAARFDRRLRLMIAALRRVSSYEEHAFSALSVLASGVSDVKRRAKDVEAKLAVTSKVQSLIWKN